MKFAFMNSHDTIWHPQTSYIRSCRSTGLNSIRYSIPGKYSVFPIRQYLTHVFVIPILKFSKYSAKTRQSLQVHRYP